MSGLAASDNSPPAAAPPPRRLSSPLPRRAPPSPSPSTSSRAKPRKPAPAEADDSLDNPDLGPFLLKQARDAMVSGEGGAAARALEFAERAARWGGDRPPSFFFSRDFVANLKKKNYI